MLADGSDSLSAGMVFVDAGGGIVHTNVSGHAMLTACDVLRISGGRVAATDPQSDRALREVLSAARTGDAADRIKGVAIPLTSRTGERHVAHILPLASGARRRAGTSYAAVALLFAHRACVGTLVAPGW
jgi:hypothetical protein